MATWRVGAARDLPIAVGESWSGPAATAGVFSWAGWPDNPKPEQARRAFLLYDADAPELKGSYKLPFALVVGGQLRASAAGLRAAASRLPQTDAPQDVLTRARGVLDAYFARMKADMLPEMERKTVTEVRELSTDAGDRTVTGFPSVFGNVDDGGDLVEPGAYLKTIQERGERMRWLWQHDKAQPPTARVLEIGEVGRAELPAALLARVPEATGALRVKREYLDTPRGNEVLAGIRAGALAELSIGYDAIKSEFPQGREVGGRPVRRSLKEIRLWEMSDVNWGMNAATTNVKALLTSGDEKGLAQWIESRIHLNFTQIADDLFGNGQLTRDERVALSNAIGNALDAFNVRMAEADLARLQQSDGEQVVDDASGMAPATVAALRRRVVVLRKQLELV